MNAEIKEKWLTALRSGDYKQERGTLRRTDNFCCLGVLCDVINPAGWLEPLLMGAIGFKDVGTTLESVGIGRYNEEILVDMNDMHEKSFIEIADWIETNL